MSTKAGRTRVLSALGALVGVLGVAFVVRTLVTRRAEVGDALAQLDAVSLVGSVALGLAAMTMIGSLWVRMLRVRGQHAPGRRAMSWYFVGQLGKYVPGGIWPIVGRAELAVRGGANRADAYVATGLSMTATYTAGAIVIAASSLLSGSYVLIGVALALGLVVTLSMLAVPAAARRVETAVLRVTRRTITLPAAGRLAAVVAVHVPVWLLMSFSTSFTAGALGAHVSILDMVFFTSASWLAGFVVIGVPGGIGVRESVFTALAGSQMGAPIAVTLALASRVVFIAVDLIGAAIASAVAALASPER
ncbi:MAG: lysylphosphatidylglycerol synthase domain-containing protein [Ilumatobacteraceae bacterium]